VDLKEIGGHDVDRIHLAQERDQWWALVNTVINLELHRIQEILDYLSES
jgi:hypothetical protein